jgi:hypothetical protein
MTWPRPVFWFLRWERGPGGFPGGLAFRRHRDADLRGISRRTDDFASAVLCLPGIGGDDGRLDMDAFKAGRLGGPGLPGPVFATSPARRPEGRWLERPEAAGQ